MTGSCASQRVIEMVNKSHPVASLAWQKYLSYLPVSLRRRTLLTCADFVKPSQVLPSCPRC